ncbi:MAG: hypothetical protein AMXMBFR61_23200 [Fimbriimonadales bacterium]
MEQDVGFDFDLHRVRAVVEVRSPAAANELLAAGWLLHDVYVSQEMRSNYILLRTEEVTCRRCGGPARVEVSLDGESFRYVCQRECS